LRGVCSVHLLHEKQPHLYRTPLNNQDPEAKPCEQVSEEIYYNSSWAHILIYFTYAWNKDTVSSEKILNRILNSSYFLGFY
jgi:hypothetical protein